MWGVLEEEADMKGMRRDELTKALSKTFQEGTVDGRAANRNGRTMPLPISTKNQPELETSQDHDESRATLGDRSAIRYPDLAGTRTPLSELPTSRGLQSGNVYSQRVGSLPSALTTLQPDTK